MNTTITLKEIAKKFKVSVSTVSKSINDSPEIGDETKQKIKAYALLKNYTPNRNAMNLKKGKTKTIGVIIPNIYDSFFAEVFSGIEKIASDRKYNVIMCLSNDSLEKELKIIEMLNDGTIDGLILSISSEAQKLREFNHYQKIINKRIPIILFDRKTYKINYDRMIGNDYISILNTTEYLIHSGCKKIALVSSISDLFIDKLRSTGYKRTQNKNNIGINSNLLLRLDTEDNLEEKISTLLDTNTIDTILALEDNKAVISLKIGHDRERGLINKLKLISSINKLIASKSIIPNSTSEMQKGNEVGKVAAKLLFEKLEINIQNINQKHYN